MNKLNIMAGSTLGAALLVVGTLGLASSAMAAGAPNSVHGTVTSISAAGIVTLQGGKEEGNAILTIDASAATKFFDVTRGGTTGTRSKVASTFTTIKVGDTLTAKGTLSNLALTATKVLDVSGPKPIHGKVTAISGSTITIREGNKKNGTTYTIDTSGSTQFFSQSKSSVFGKWTKMNIALSNIQIGQKIAVHGTMAAANLVNATTVIDRG